MSTTTKKTTQNLEAKNKVSQTLERVKSQLFLKVELVEIRCHGRDIYFIVDFVRSSQTMKRDDWTGHEK